MIDRPSDTLALAAEFPPATYTQWRKLVEDILKGDSFEERLQSRSTDGFVIEPLYMRAPAAPSLAGRATGQPWQVMQRIDHPDTNAANRQAREDLEGSADGLVLVGADSGAAHGFGLKPASETIEATLKGVRLDASVAIEFDLGPQANLLAIVFAAYVVNRGLAPASLNVRFGFDPLGDALSGGRCDVRLRELGPYVGRLTTDLSALGFRHALLKADGRIVHSAGGTEAQELAFVLAVAVSYLRAVEAAGIALDAARHMIFFRLAADSDQFLTIAKFQSLRRLWQRVEESCGLSPKPAFISAETAWRTMTRNDPQTNILRATIATFAAGIGGADAITVLPYTAAHGLPDRFARRIARNTQLILTQEANLARVNDPAAGTGWSVDLVDKLAHTAWALFQEIERAGGAAAALEQGLIQDKIKTARAALEHDVATRRITLVGANDYANISEANVAVLDLAPVILPPSSAPIEIKRLVPMRLAQPFEALRDAADRILAATGKRPEIFLAGLGPTADFTTRTTFAKNFFAVGGIAAIEPREFAGDEDVAQRFKASGTTLACLCGSDGAYAREGINAARSLRAMGATHVYLAGRPLAHEAELRQAGVGTFIHSGCDTLAVLQEAQRMFGSS